MQIWRNRQTLQPQKLVLKRVRVQVPLSVPSRGLLLVKYDISINKLAFQKTTSATKALLIWVSKPLKQAVRSVKPALSSSSGCDSLLAHHMAVYPPHINRQSERYLGGQVFPSTTTKPVRHYMGLQFTWENASLARMRQPVRVRPGPPLNPRLRKIVERFATFTRLQQCTRWAHIPTVLTFEVDQYTPHWFQQENQRPSYIP